MENSLEEIVVGLKNYRKFGDPSFKEQKKTIFYVLVFSNLKFLLFMDFDVYRTKPHGTLSILNIFFFKLSRYISEQLN